MFTSVIAQGLLLFSISWALWRSLTRSSAINSLDNLPGPASTSLLKGNFGQVFNSEGWDFHKQIAEQFGKVAGVYGSFVKTSLCLRPEGDAPHHCKGPLVHLGRDEWFHY
ncbi:hypothetical protein LshimejAT787_0803580 [Lyophyllum shimeji]|uniref:Uncharacterized protein n=1 Tax=Lyophyllum shimeji TaxID=47721 RepID=A0A9P3PSD4_LYOSH|nr:hypothetical protein LshimejAT787_0803580 [Lyophyllum shimeji]